MRSNLANIYTKTMKDAKTCLYPEQAPAVAGVGRRKFLAKSVAAAFAAPLLTSLEESDLQAKDEKPAAPAPGSRGTVPLGKIGNVQISRLICGGNLVSGFAHSRDLIYVSPLLKHYFTEEKVMETWSLCEQHGINTMILNPSHTRELEIYKKYRAQGGKIQYLAQVNPAENDVSQCVKEAQDCGASGVFLLGNISDRWTRDGKTALIGELVAHIKQRGLIAGAAMHELRSVKAIEEAKCNVDFYMKTLHSTDYWSTRRPEQTKDVIDNYSVDNYWCNNPKETIGYMSEINKPWIAYKVLAAGAIHPKAGFRYAFENGADFAAVGIFDFQIADDVGYAGKAIAEARERERPWRG